MSSRSGRNPALLALGLVAVGGAVTFASPSLWPLLALPLVFAVPLAGSAGLGIAAVVSAGVLGIVAGRPGADVVPVIVGWLGFLALGALVGARLTKVTADLDRVSGASLKDRLTGLYNFAFFSDALRRECQRTTRYGGDLSLVLFDLDGFKSFNDTHGHAIGNVLLAEVGRVIDGTRRSADVAARFGGEEFALLVPGPAEMAVEAAERIRVAIARITVEVGKGQHDGRTISAGVAAYRRGDPHENLVELADRALYLSKRRGRNRVSVSGYGDAPRHAAGA